MCYNEGNCELEKYLIRQVPFGKSKAMLKPISKQRKSSVSSFTHSIDWRKSIIHFLNLWPEWTNLNLKSVFELMKRTEKLLIVLIRHPPYSQMFLSAGYLQMNTFSLVRQVSSDQVIWQFTRLFEKFLFVMLFVRDS